MQDKVRNDIGTKEPLKDWADINWKLVKKRIRNLRQRIYRAIQNRQRNKVRSLMKLTLRSYSNLLLSVRRITSENHGKKTAGIDNQKVSTHEDRVALVKEVQEKPRGKFAQLRGYTFQNQMENKDHWEFLQSKTE